nr:GNAT family N-acetyltransferase [Shewanella insulae]
MGFQRVAEKGTRALKRLGVLDVSINFRPFNKSDGNYSKVIELYKEAFPGAQRIPTFLLRFKLRKGKKGFSVLYDGEEWIGLIYLTQYRDIVFVQFLAVSESIRSKGYGSKVMDALGDLYPEKRMVLNIEEVNEQARNYRQRIKRKAFYEKNGFISTGYLVKEPDQMQEMLIRGGSISKEEIELMYKELLGNIIGSLIRPRVIKA